jgi:ribonucleoside-diphosphate reductase alpha chain
MQNTKIEKSKRRKKKKNIKINLYILLIINMSIQKKSERSLSLNEEMYVTKRNGKKEIVSFDKILNRIKKIGQTTNMKLNYTSLVMKVIDQLFDGISTTKIDELSAEQCATMASIHPDYSILAGSIIISNHHKNTSDSFVDVMSNLYFYLDKHEKHSPLISEKTYEIIQKNSQFFEEICDYSRDYLIDYFGFKTLERAYLMKINNKIVERIQHMWLRVSIGIHEDDLEKVKETYDLMSMKYFTHATPTLFNAGTPHPQCSSCYLLSMESDSIDGIYNTLKECALISKWAGGIGLHIHNVRASGSHIRGTNGTSNGIVPMLKVFNHTAKYVDQGGGKRNGSFAIYLEPWHADIEMFLQMRKNHGDEELKARDLFYALWVPDLFMERIKADGTWTLMCPDECPGLSDVYGDEFKELYTKYERENKGRVTMKARDLWFQVLDAQMETGTPYLVYKDAANKKSNQQNVGTIKSSNLCVAPETMILTDKGYFRIENLENETVKVWNGEEFTETTVKKTGENQELIEIHFDDGTRIDCTKYHKFYIRNDKSIDDDDDHHEKHDDVICLKAKDLSIGDYIIDYSLPVINGKDKYLELEFESELNQTFTYLPPYTHGVLSSTAGKYDYSITKYRTNGSDSIPVLKISQHKDEILPYLNYIRRTEEFVYEDNKDILYSTLFLSSNVGDKFYVPINDSLKYKLEWFSGLCDIDAKVSEKVNTVTLESVNITFARELKLMLQTCGVNSYSVELGFVNYVCIDIPSMVKLINLGLKLRCKNIEKFILEKYEKMVQLNNVYSSRKKMVSRIVHKGRRSDTFCFTESKRGMGIFNGIITGQCSEIIQYSDENETAVCNLSSIALPSFVEMDNVTNKNIINYEKLHEVTKVITENLNKIIDINYYPTEKTRLSNMRHRPIGIGVQGLADVFMMMNLPFGSDEARKLNHDIFETIYYAALECSSELSQKYGSYETFLGSPASKGQLQFDLWGISPTLEGEEPRYDWNEMRERIKLYGLRNSLLLAPMPTASTSQILGNNECIEPITSNIYNRRTIAGEFILANKYLMNDLIKLDLWNEKIKNNIIANNGSVQHIDVIPSEIREKYKTVWEIPMRTLIDMAADRGAFICQSQSLNLWLEEPNYSNLTSMHFYAWSKGLKTGIYYLRRRGRHQAQQFTIEPEKKDLENNLYEDDEPCEMCSA